ncbi:MAG: DNA primase catalytic subunit PriS [Methanosarcinales archaeon]|nr:DNA primase catalytic subunit PriS [Methanosarcinales archaeon]
MNSTTVLFLKRKFQEHYKQHPPQSPPQLNQREWGFLMFDPGSGMYRHKAFYNDQEMHEYIQYMAPAHVYHSTAYYEHPSASTMKEKSWLGADLIFDLDADHLPNVPDSYKDMLKSVKKETLRLIDFLLDDFGFEEDELYIAFSGGRGYHIHIRDPKVRKLDSAQRREIIDYVSGTGLKKNRIFKKKTIEGDNKRSKVLVFPSESQGGWGKLINKKLITYLQIQVDDEDAEKKLMEFKAIGKKKAIKIIDTINSPAQLEQMKNGNFSALSSIPVEFWENALDKIIPTIKVNIDEPVSADIKRLIRVASSLHGKTGLKVIPLTIDELSGFEPLVDAVVFGDNKIMINVIRASIVELKNECFEVEEGKNILPEYAAIYLMCKGAAEFMEVLK